MYAFKRVIVVSALTLTANSWGYPIYPYAEFFNQLNAHRSLNVKSDISAAIESYIEQASTEATAKTVIGKNSVAADVANSSSSINAFNNEVVEFDPRSASGGSWYSTSPARNFSLASPRFWFDAQQGEQSSDHSFKEIGSLKEIASLAPGNESSHLWVGLNLKDVLPGESGKDAAKNKNDASKKDDTNAADGKVSRVSVSEPSSIALVGSGLLGLVLVRRLGRRNQKNPAFG